METALYLPVKRFLETFGYEVKGEIGGCDVVGIKAGETPIVVIAELKLTFTLELVLQGIDRMPACDEVWLAARLSKRGGGREADARFRNLCRRLGFGLLGVGANGSVHVLLSPVAPASRRDPKRRSALADEHRKRQGDPVAGGSTRVPLMTAYRQQALACAAALAQGPRRPRDLKATLPDAPKILQSNVYGWFGKVERGVYALNAAGAAALQRWPTPAPFFPSPAALEKGANASSVDAAPRTLALQPLRRHCRPAPVIVGRA